MQRHISEITRIQRKVLVEVSRLAFSDKLVDGVDSLPRKLTDEAGLTNYRCCKYKERAILADRIRLAMGFDPMGDTDARLSELASRAMEGESSADTSGQRAVKLIDIACDRCPIEKIVVTDSCRNCVGHYCRNSCHKDAIYIIQDRAFIDKAKCVECGKCARACPFNAILQLERPCERACAVNAISHGETHNAVIDYDRCVDCAACSSGCPFGAISPTSDLLKAIRLLKDPDTTTVALVAPSFAGQFGPTVGPGQVRAGLLALGFGGVVEVAAGAEAVAEREASELLAKEGPMTTSCCPSFTALVHKHYPELAGAVSHTPSPMLETAEMVAGDPGRFGLPQGKPLAFAFIGPCHAKRVEAHGTRVSAVLTFEELTCMLVAEGINLAALDAGTDGMNDAGSAGRLFARSGGPGEAVLGAAKTLDPAFDASIAKAAGLPECKACLDALKKALPSPGEGGALPSLLEGMACEGGCIGGPAALVNPAVSGRALAKMAEGR